MATPPPPGPGTPQQQPPHGQSPYPSHPSHPSHPSYPYAQQPAAPYQPWPGGAYSPYAHPPVNGFAIASLVLGILCFLPGIGLVLGIVAFAQIKKKGERGKGMAVAGSILSSVGLAFLVVGLVTGGARDFVDDFKEGMRDAASPSFPVGEGECFNAPGNRLDRLEYAYQVDATPCSGRHTGEVFGSFRVNFDSYPGDLAITSLADRRCTALSRSYVKDLPEAPGGVEVYYFAPSHETWKRGDREVTCIFGSADEGGTLTGAVRDGAQGAEGADTGTAV